MALGQIAECVIVVSLVHKHVWHGHLDANSLFDQGWDMQLLGLRNYLPVQAASAL